jgi:carbonic anhydrase
MFISLLSSSVTFLALSLPFVLGFNYVNHGIDWPGTCNTSIAQSPVDINLDFVKILDKKDPNYWYLDLHYKKVHVINLNSTKPIPITSGFTFNPSINFNIFSNFGKISQKFSNNEKIFEANSISFKYPAEHTFNGKRRGNDGKELLEVQITHVSTDNKNDTLVLSALFQQSDQKNHFLQQVIEAYYSSIGGDIDCTFVTNGWFVVKNFFTYEGSLSIPPCREGVTWVIDMDYINCTKTQIEFFKQKLNISNGGNFRYTFPLVGRVVKNHIAAVFSFGMFKKGMIGLIIILVVFM